MHLQKINIVWLKRDIRSTDHLPLFYAEQSPLPYLVLFIFDEDALKHPDCSLRHLQFQYQSLLDLKNRLSAFSFQINICYGQSIAVFSKILKEFDVQQVLSYQETGIRLTFDIDLSLKKLFTSKQIPWKEYQRDGILRGIKNRKKWDDAWFHMAHSPIIEFEYSNKKTMSWQHPFTLSNEQQLLYQKYSPYFQPAGETYAWKYIQNFVEQRINNYSRHISKPALSRISCSRLSPYLAWGNISIRQVYQYVYDDARKKSQKNPHQNFLTRLTWHCHFLQKFETVCEYETHCINAAFEGVWKEKDNTLIQAWKNGQSGYPLVDAAMRCVIKTGWINFRMRALLVSFLSHHLFQDWRHGVYHLAKQFLDYEPGIHYTQFQMQAGSTGVNVLRVYNPILNSQQHDENATFILQWCPELAGLPTLLVFEPWKINPMEEIFYNFNLGQSYPNRIVKLEENRQKIKKLWETRKSDLAKSEGAQIVATLVRINKFKIKKSKKLK